MEWLRSIFGFSRAKRLAALERIQKKYSLFKELLDLHNQTLKKVSTVEGWSQKQSGIGQGALYDEIVKIQEGMSSTVEKMIELGGNSFLPLRDTLADQSRQIENYFLSYIPVPPDDFVIPFSELRADRARSVGTKNAHLGELRTQLGLPVPDGFAISAHAYRYFLEYNKLHERIPRLLKDIKVRNYRAYEIISEEIRELVASRPIPEDLSMAINNAFEQLIGDNPGRRIAMRSSALGEDTTFTFAGQYMTCLNIDRQRLLNSYREILASMFTPSAIHYLFRHDFAESGPAMAVVCMHMVDARSSGVIYSRDPLNEASAYTVINSIYGLGRYLVEGMVTPDEFRVIPESGQIVLSRITDKNILLKLNSDGTVAEGLVPEAERLEASLNPAQLHELAKFGRIVEKSFGTPQDIEWAVDHDGRLFLLQARPLKFPRQPQVISLSIDDNTKILAKNGITLCPGIGTGPVHIIKSVEEAAETPSGAVLVAPNPSPKLIAAMHKINALITQVGGNASHLATLARELALPSIGGITAINELTPGREITVDATNGIIYDGIHSGNAPAGFIEKEKNNIEYNSGAVQKALHKITQLTFINPADPNFTPEGCVSFHDILRFIHQKSMEEIYRILKGTTGKESISLRLKSSIPLPVNIIYLDQTSFLATQSKRRINEDELDSVPMKSFWQGVLKEGWPAQPSQGDIKGLMAVIGTNLKGPHQQEFAEISYAFLSKEYMLLNLRMGYHFSTIEAMAAAEPEKNYIRMQFKLGGAPLERRIRRIWLICELLRLVGFENSSQGDFLDTSVAYLDATEICERLYILGRLTILTKQLDLALGSDARAQWFLDEFTKKLGLKEDRGKL